MEASLRVSFSLRTQELKRFFRRVDNRDRGMELASVKARGFWLADVSADWVVSNAQARQKAMRRDEKGIEERRREEREKERASGVG